MTLTQSRTIQWLGIILIALVLGLSYWYFSVRAGVTTNSSVSQPQGTGRLDSGLVGYWPLDNGSGTTATDLSTNGNNGTLTNFPGSPWTTGQVAGALDFDGTNDTVATSSVRGTVNVTMSLWIRPDSVTGTREVIFHDNNWGIDLENDELTWYWEGGSAFHRTTAANLATGQWYHIVGTYFSGGSSNNVQIYVNGLNQVLDNDDEATTPTGGTGTVTLSTTGFPYDGRIDEVRIYNRTLSAEEVTRLYSLTTPTAVDTGLKGYWSFNGQDVNGTTAYDRSGAGNTGTLTNGPTVTEGKVGQALSFDGSDDNVTVADTSDFTGSALTVAFWKKDTNVLSNRAFVTKSASADRSWSIEGDDVSTGNGDTAVRFYVANGLTDVSQSGVTPSVMEAGKWHHVVAVFNGAGSGNSGRMQIYIDGIAQTLSFTGTIPSSLQNNSIGLRMGQGGLTSNLFLGSMDEVRVYNRALTAAEVRGLYDTGSSDKLGTSAGQAQGGNSLSAGLALYWPLDDGSGTNADDKSTNSNDGTLTNGPTFTTGQIGGGVDFDGTDDFITLADPSSGVLDFNIPYDASTPGDVFTLSAWFNRDTFTTDDTIIAKKNGITDTEDGYIVWIDDATDEINVRVDGNADPNGSWVTSSTTYATTGWHHVAVVVDDYRMPNHDLCPTIFVDGVDVTDTASCLALGGFLYYVGDASNSVAFRAGAESDGGNPFDGKLDDIRVYSRPINAEEVRLLAATTATTSGIDTGLKGYWSFDAGDTGTTGNTQYRAAYDRSGVGNTGTLTNGPTAARGQVGQALSFDGTDDYIDTGQATPYQFANTTFTTTGWFKKSSGAANSHIIAQGGCSGGWSVNLATGTLRATLKSTGSCGSVPASRESATTTLNDGQWHHFAAIFTTNTTTPASNTVSLYVDGVLNNGTLTQSGTSYNTSATNLQIGSRDGGVDSPFVGSLDEIRVYSRALTAAEIRAQYDAGAPDKVNSSVSQPQGSGRLDSGLLGYWKLDETTGSSAADASTNGNAGTLTNMENGDWTTGRIGNGLTFDGTNEYITMGDINTMDGLTQLTVSAWAKSSSVTSQRGIVNKSGCNGVTDSGTFEISAGYTSGKAEFCIYPSGDTPIPITCVTAANTMDDGSWHHLTGVYDGASITLYQDGVVSATAAAAASDLSANSVPVTIGSCNTVNFWNDMIDEVRVYNRAFSANEVRQLYGVTAPTGVDTGLKGYWSFNGQDVVGTTAHDRSGAGHNGTLTNSPRAVGGKVGQALSFWPNGSDTDAYVTVSDPSSGALDFGSSDFSVGLWMKGRGYSSQGSSLNLMMDKKDTDTPGAAGYTMLYASDNLVTFRIANGTSDFSATQTVATAADNQWHYYTGVRSGTTIYLYVDGILAATTTSATGSVSNNQAVEIGGDATNARNVDGAIDEVRIYSRALTAAEIKSLYNSGK